MDYKITLKKFSKYFGCFTLFSLAFLLIILNLKIELSFEAFCKIDNNNKMIIINTFDIANLKKGQNINFYLNKKFYRKKIDTIVFNHQLKKFTITWKEQNQSFLNHSILKINIVYDIKKIYKFFF